MGRRYRQYCGLAHALEIVGERWSGLIVRDLTLGPQRYSDLRDGLPGVATNVLAERLKHLEAQGIIIRKSLPPPAASTVYQLTDDGRALADALMPLAQWGVQRLEAPGADLVRPEWLAFGLRAQFEPENARGVHDVYEFHVDDTVFHARVDDGTLTIARGAAPGPPDLTIVTDASSLMGIGRGIRPDPARYVVTQHRAGAARRSADVFGVHFRTRTDEHAVVSADTPS
jgi:DNA-binding HxlR family transcriptional regulator